MVLQCQEKLEFARLQVFEDRQYPAPTAGRHEIIGVLHAGGNAGQLARCRQTERREPGR